ncbi:MAG: hypothetical protein RSD17_02740 [Oscillospiraceae bacterium]
MAKITERINGFSKMTDAEKLSALLELEEAEPDHTGFIKKDRFDEVTSELASMKKKIKEKMSEDEIAEQERATMEAEREALLEKLIKEKSISDTTAKFLGLGYGEKFAKETAEAFVNGESDKVFANQQKFLESQRKKWEEDLLNKTPPPPNGSKDENTGMTKEEFSKLGLSERQKYADEHPEEVKKII